MSKNENEKKRERKGNGYDVKKIYKIFFYLYMHNTSHVVSNHFLISNIEKT